MSGSFRALCVVVSLAALYASDAAAQGQLTDTVRLSTVLRVAQDSNPMLRAARSGAMAAAQRVGPAGALPDPQLQFGLMNRMISDFGSTADPMTMNQFQLMQMLPWPGKLGGARAAAGHNAVAAEADVDEQARMLRAQVRMAYYDLAYADRAAAVMRETRGLLRQYLEDVRGRLRRPAGRAPRAGRSCADDRGDHPHGTGAPGWRGSAERHLGP